MRQLWRVGAWSPLVDHPDVRFPVIASRVADLEWCETLREHVLTVGGERHPSPGFPFGNRCSDAERFGFRAQDPPTEAGVHTHPRIERQSGTIPPVGVLLDRNQRVAVLPARPHRRDEGLNAYLRLHAEATRELSAGASAVEDVDTPEDYERLLRAYR